MTTKRQRTDSENDFNDTLQGAISEFKSLEDPTIKDMGNLLATCLEKLMTVHHKAFDNANEIVELKSTAESHSMKIHSLEYKMTQIDEKTNRLEQLNIDNDIFISGFPTKPEPNEITTKLLKILKLPPTSIAYKYAFSLNNQRKSRSSTPNKNQKAQHFMIISFINSHYKTLFFKTRKEMGKITYKQLVNDPDKCEKDPTIKFSNRLTVFNSKVSQQLIKLKEMKKVHSFQIHNGYTRVKIQQNSRWSLIKTGTDLTKLLEELDSTQFSIDDDN